MDQQSRFQCLELEYRNSMISNKSRISAVLLMIIVAGSVRAEDAKEVVVASAKE